MDPGEKLIIGFRRASVSSIQVTYSKLILANISRKIAQFWKNEISTKQNVENK